MTNKFNRIKAANDVIEAINKNKFSFQHYAVETIIEMRAEQMALSRLLSKKKLIHPKELNTEIIKVKRILAKNLKNMKKVMIK
ncbi:MAG: hypothetical protein KJ623_04695 [Nanoarchaeota archaeon]|nr:hypothetical protein [Nanoarchaeota archaeon]MBU0962511.1 hypothetical protein [Nanoarchaeota archaeon]